MDRAGSRAGGCDGRKKRFPWACSLSPSQTIPALSPRSPPPPPPPAARRSRVGPEGSGPAELGQQPLCVFGGCERAGRGVGRMGWFCDLIQKTLSFPLALVSLSLTHTHTLTHTHSHSHRDSHHRFVRLVSSWKNSSGDPLRFPRPAAPPDPPPPAAQVGAAAARPARHPASRASVTPAATAMNAPSGRWPVARARRVRETGVATAHALAARPAAAAGRSARAPGPSAPVAAAPTAHPARNGQAVPSRGPAARLSPWLARPMAANRRRATASPEARRMDRLLREREKRGGRGVRGAKGGMGLCRQSPCFFFFFFFFLSLSLSLYSPGPAIRALAPVHDRHARPGFVAQALDALQLFVGRGRMRKE